MSNHHLNHALSHAIKHEEKLPLIEEGKKPLPAFIAGFIGGPFLAAAYLKSWPDFFILLILLIAFSVSTLGTLSLLAWAGCGGWAAYRVVQSNKRRRPPPGSASAPVGHLAPMPSAPPPLAAQQGATVVWS